MESRLLINGVFQVYKSKIIGREQQVDGRLLSDMDINDQFIVGRYLDTNYYSKNCDKNGTICIKNTSELKSVEIISIKSYGNFWKYLHKGMSARIECRCDTELVEDSIIYKIVC